MEPPVRVVRVADESTRELPGSTRCTAAPDDLDDEAGGLSVERITDGTLQVRYFGPDGEDRPASLAIAALSGFGAGARVCVESDERDDRGRLFWWLAERLES